MTHTNATLANPDFPEVRVVLPFHYDYLFFPEITIIIVLIIFWKCTDPWWRWVLQATLVPILMAIYSILAWNRAWSVWNDTDGLTHFIHQEIIGPHPPEFVNNIWKEEVSLEDYPNLFRLVCFAPWAFVVNFCVTVAHLGKIVLKMYVSPLKQRDARVAAADELKIGLLSDEIQTFDKLEDTFWIVSLPLVYGYFSFMAALDMWVFLADAPACVANATTLNESAWRLEFLHVQEAYADKFEARLGAGDAYEAVVLFLFGRLMVSVVQEQLAHQQKLHNSNCGEALEPERAHLLRRVSSDALLAPTPLRSPSNDSDLISIASSTTARFLDMISNHTMSERRLANLGMRYFIITCLLTCIWEQFIVSLRYFRGPSFSAWGRLYSYEVVTRLLPAGSRAYIDAFLYGAGFACSFAAIEHIFVIESHHHYVLEHRKNFRSCVKFASVKIMVTLVFLQGVLHTLFFSDWKETRWKLCHASAFVVECLLLSIMHWFAWDTNEDWYKEARARDKEAGAGSQGTLAIAESRVRAAERELEDARAELERAKAKQQAAASA